jgi:hypothetical protein
MNERRIRQLAEQAGCDVDEITQGKHYKVLLRKNGVKGIVTVSRTSSDPHRAEKNVLSDMKRIGREGCNG